jgi:hypothetical protein
MMWNNGGLFQAVSGALADTGGKVLQSFNHSVECDQMKQENLFLRSILTYAFFFSMEFEWVR